MQALKKHRRLVIWGVAGAIVLVVFLLRSRAQSAAASSSTPTGATDPNAAGPATDPYASYDSGYAAGLSSGGGGGSGGYYPPTPTPTPTPTPAPVPGGQVAAYTLLNGRKVYGFGRKGHPFYSLANYRRALKLEAARVARARTVRRITTTGHPLKGAGSGTVARP